MTETELAELTLPGGGTVVVRAERISGDDHDEGPDNYNEGPTDIGLKEALSFSVVRSALRGVATDVHEAIKTVAPDTAEVEFGFELALKGSKLVCLLVDGDTKATLKIRLEWREGSTAEAE